MNSAAKEKTPVLPSKEVTIPALITLEELESIVEKEGNTFQVLNTGFRELLAQKGTLYQLGWLDSPMTLKRLPFKPKMTRAVAELYRNGATVHFLVIETVSYSAGAKKESHDPQKGDLFIWPLKKDNRSPNETVVTGKDSVISVFNEVHSLFLRRDISEKGFVYDTGFVSEPITVGRRGWPATRNIYFDKQARVLLKNTISQAKLQRKAQVVSLEANALE